MHGKRVLKKGKEWGHGREAGILGAFASRKHIDRASLSNGVTGRASVVLTLSSRRSPLNIRTHLSLPLYAMF